MMKIKRRINAYRLRKGAMEGLFLCHSWYLKVERKIAFEDTENYYFEDEYVLYNGWNMHFARRNLRKHYNWNIV